MKNTKFLFDNGFLRDLLNDSKAEMRKDFSIFFKKEFNLFFFQQKGLMLVTPALFLEFVGFGHIPNPNIVMPKELRQKIILDQIDYVNEKAFKFFSKSKELRRSRLMELAEVQSWKYLSKESKVICQEIIQSIKDDRFYIEILNYLALDYSYRYSLYSKPDEFLIYTIWDIYKLSSMKLTVSFYRALRFLWPSIERKLKNENSSKRHIDSYKNAIMLKNRKDCLDADIIHYTTVGHVLDGNVKKVICFTYDDITILKRRLIFYKGLLDSTLPILKEERRKVTFDTFEFKRGEIFVFERGSQKLLSKIDVKKVKRA